MDQADAPIDHNSWRKRKGAVPTARKNENRRRWSCLRSFGRRILSLLCSYCLWSALSWWTRCAGSLRSFLLRQREGGSGFRGIRT